MTDRFAHSSGWLLPGLLLLAAGLRIPGLFTDFWLDEIWTLKLALAMDSAWDVFSEVRHSNNHHLNTLWFYTLGYIDGLEGANGWIPYRIPALLAGIGSVGLAWRIGLRGGRLEAAVAAGLCACSYLLVHYSSDARGYALVIFFGLASFDLLTRFQQERRTRDAALFWLCAGLGFLSHLMYLHVFVAAGLWTGVALVRQGRADDAVVRTVLRDSLRLFAVPTLFLLCFYWFDVRLTKIGDGPELNASEVFVRALSYALGGPPGGLLAGRVAVSTVVFFAAAVVWWQRQGRDAWVFLAVVIFLSPAVTFLLMTPDVFFVRYFLLSTVFGLVAMAAPLARGLERGGVWRWTAALLLAAFALGNGLRIANFYEYGRGDYLGTLRQISESATSRLPTVGGDHRFRTHNVIRFYNRLLPEDRRIVYADQKDGPDWLLLHRIGQLGEYSTELHHGDVSYQLVRVAPYSDLSGWHWLIYRRGSP